MDLKKIMPRLKIWAILFVIFLVGFSIRYLPHGEKVYDPDSYNWFRLSEYFAGINTKYIGYVDSEFIDQLRYYPYGRNLGHELLLLPLAIGYSFKFLGTFGIAQTSENLMRYMIFFGPFFGGLKAVVAYFLVKEISNARTAAFASVFYSISQQSLSRNSAGDTGQESLGGLLIFLWLYLFFKAAKEKEFRKNVALAAAGGFSFALANVTWGGNIFYLGLISASMLLFLIYTVLKNEVEKYASLLGTYAVVMVIGNLLSWILRPMKYPLINVETVYLFAYFTAFISTSVLVMSEINKKIRKNISALQTFIGAVCVILLMLLITDKLSAFIEMSTHFYYEGLILGQKGLTEATVAYYRPASMEELRASFGVLLILSLFGGVYLLYDFYKKREFRSIFLILWAIFGVVAFRWMVRLSFYLALVVPILVLILFNAAREYNSRKEKNAEAMLKSSKKAMKEKALSTKSSIKFSNFLIAALLVFLLVSSLDPSVAFARSMKGADRQVNPWRDAGLWLKSNTPEDALLISWWDYGYYLQTYAERRTIVDGGNSGRPPPDTLGGRNVDVATMFTSTEDRAPEIIKMYNLESRPIYMLVSVEEFGKSGAINYHAKDQLYLTSFRVEKSGSEEQDNRRIREIFSRNLIKIFSVTDAGSYYFIWALLQVDESGNYHPEWGDKLLAKLLPLNTVVGQELKLFGLGQGLKHFKLVYSNGYVFVYKFEP